VPAISRSFLVTVLDNVWDGSLVILRPPGVITSCFLHMDLVTMSGLVKGIFGAVAKQYQSIVASRCAALGKFDILEVMCPWRKYLSRFIVRL